MGLALGLVLALGNWFYGGFWSLGCGEIWYVGSLGVGLWKGRLMG